MAQLENAPLQGPAVAMKRTVRVVVADDSARFRAGIVRSLRQRGGVDVVAEVGDGAAAIAATRALMPDVLVVDDRMPVLGGFAVARALAADPVLQAVRLVMLSASSSAALSVEAAEAGAFMRIDKGLSRSEICATIRRAGNRAGAPAW